jgi:fumarylacetoacetase
MQLGLVVGTATATVKHPTLTGWKLLVVQPLLADGRSPDGDPQPLPYLLDAADQAHGALDIECEVLLATPAMRATGAEPHRLCRSNTRDLYWTVAQMVAHHASNGCNLRAGDLFGSGTISGTDPTAIGCLLEMTFGGRDTITLGNGETRRYLEDDDVVVFKAHCRRPGAVTIGFGECRGRIVPGTAA